jgi:hypothetical protein
VRFGRDLAYYLPETVADSPERISVSGDRRPTGSAEKGVAGPQRSSETREIRLTAPVFATDI